MKTLKCEICGADIKGKDFDSWFKAAHDHWASNHADLMKAMEEKPKEEGEKWMVEAKKKFEAADE